MDLIRSASWLVGMVLFLAAPGLAFVQEETSDSDFVAVALLSYQCPDFGEGPGSSRDRPIAIDFDDLYWDAEAAIEDGEPGQYHCRFVQLSGQFRASEYWHYRGSLYPNAVRAYRNPFTRFWIESFFEPERRRSDIHASDVEIVALFYNLCSVNPDAENVWIFGGPCSTSPLSGYMLQDVEIVYQRGPLNQRWRGEVNRPFGDITRLVLPEHVNPMRDATFRWAEQILTSEETYLRALLDEGWISRDEFDEALRDDDDWVSNVLRHDRATRVLLQASLPIESRFAAFGETESLNAVANGEPALRRSYGCICLSETCANSWPLFEIDVVWMTDDYICTELRLSGNEWTAVL